MTTIVTIVRIVGTTNNGDLETTTIKIANNGNH